LEFHKARGFGALDLPQGAQRPSAEIVVPAIIEAHGKINGMQIKALAKEQRVGKNAVDAFLKTWPNWTPGRGSERFYLPKETAPTGEMRAA